MTGNQSASGFKAYGDFVKDELAAQDQRKTSFEQRGVAVITTSGALVTLLFALAALSTKEAQTFVLPDSARSWLNVALVLFVLAAVAALATNVPLSYQAVDAAAIKDRLKAVPVKGADEATKDIALTRVKALRDAKLKNSIKGWLLFAGMGFEMLAVGCVALAISHVL
jgi:hypothetical protein